MKFTLKIIVIIFFLGILSTSPAAAAEVIKSADYSKVNITVEGLPLELENPPVSVVKEGETNAGLYMPLRELSEKLGYTVQWDEATKTVHLTNRRSLPDSFAEDEPFSQEYTTVFEIENNKNYVLAQSGSFQAEEGQILQLNVSSHIADGSIDLLLFNPEGKEQRITLDSQSIKAEILLTQGKWEYEACGVYNLGSIKILGCVK